MKLLDIVCLFCFSMFVFWVDTADAANWRRAKGTMILIDFQDSTGAVIDDIFDRRVSADIDIRRKGNSNNFKSSCKDNKKLRERRCRAEFTKPVEGLGVCGYINSTVLYNFTSKSRNIFANLKSSYICSTGYIGYFEAEGRLRRS